MRTADEAFERFRILVLEFEWLVNHYRHKSLMQRDGRIFGQFYVEPDSKKAGCAL